MGFTRSRSCTSGILAAALLASFAEGAERGGVDSPFAGGVGARALALGGAYAAIAEGPTALAWNPAGLAVSERKELTFFYTSPFIEGNRYTFLGYAHPFLGFGTVGFGNTRYGVSDIEKYDAGGSALGTFSSVQNEWTFAYALPTIGPVALGAAVKAETHSIDGYSSTGIGADVGVLVRSENTSASLLSRANLSFGGAVINALQPTLTLAEGDDRIPGLLRLGVAYRLPLRGGPTEHLTLLIGMDQGMKSGGRIRMGAECVLGSGLSLRAGATGEEWSGGFGFEIGGGSLDYAYGSADLGSVHRLGLTLSFGSSTGDLLEARKAEEARILDQRTVEEIARKEEGQLRASLEEGNSRLARSEYTEAEAAFERALLWNAESEEGKAGLARARVGRHLAAGVERSAAGDLLEAIAEYSAALAIDPGNESAAELARAATERLNRSAARSREVSGHLTRGIEFLALSEFPDAESEFEKALEIEPNNADALRYRERADSLVAQRVDALVSEGDWFRDRGSAETAIERYREALALRPDRDDLGREIARLRAAPAAAPVTEAAPPEREKPAPKRLSPDEVREAEGMYRTGLDAFKEGRNEEAIRYFEFVYGLSPAYENVESYLKQAHLFRGMDLYTAGRLDEAIRSWERILEIDPEDQKTLSYLQRARAEIRKTKDLSGGNP
jgi:tetratricopeptide (TPR) repeat protein